MLLQDLVNRYITEDTLSCTDGESGMKQSSSMASGDQIWFTDLFSSNELPGRRVHSSAAETGGLRLGATVLGGRSSKYRTGEETPSDQSEQSAFSSQVQVTDSGVFTTEVGIHIDTKILGLKDQLLETSVSIKASRTSLKR